MNNDSSNNDYKNTLNLPQTDFPMKANLATKELDILATWRQNGLYNHIREAKQGKPLFVLHDGPPYANGHLHCGHALNKILKDIIVKSKTLSDFDAPYVPGWDCHGLPIELNVEKKIGKAGHKVSAKEFREECRNYAKSQIAIQKLEFERLGVIGDWDNPYTTMDSSYEAIIIKCLKDIIANGHLTQGFKPVHWCLDCSSALAEAEVDYENKSSPAIDVAFLVENPEIIYKKLSVHEPHNSIIVPIWTTTPWTLPANEAVCINPELEYVLIDAGLQYMIVASELVTQVGARYNLNTWSICHVFQGKELAGIQLKHPLENRNVPLIFGSHVTTEAGTGCVHTAPAHGPDDHIVGKQYNLPVNNHIQKNGVFNTNTPIVGGVHVTKADSIIVEALRDNKTLLAHETIYHSYPHCWRHKKPMIFLATEQWFIAMTDEIRSNLLSAITKVQWLPEWGQARIAKMIENRPDWCISRQRAWGTPLPIFVHKETRQPHPNTIAFMDKIADLVAQDGIEAWFSLEPHTLLGKDSDNYEPIYDTLDVWFDSGVSHSAVLKQRPELSYPADLYLEGSDQHRGWFNSSLTTAIAIDNTAPFKKVLTHGYTVDANGNKLSKSKGNYIELTELIKQNGADILRLWVASTDYRHEVSLSPEIITRTGEAYRRIRNTARFLLANLFDFDPKTHALPGQDWLELDRYMLQRTQELQDEIIAAYDEFAFHVVYQKIHHFCSIELGAFYLDVIKDRQYTSKSSSIARRSCQTVIYNILQALVRWIAPILTFTATEIAGYIPEIDKNILLGTWYQGWPQIKPVNMAEWQYLQQLRDEVNKALEIARQQNLIGSALAANVALYLDSKAHHKLARIASELKFLFITSKVELYEYQTAPKDALDCSELGIKIKIAASSYQKCLRCWHRDEHVGQSNIHPQLCPRCITNIGDNPATRIFI